VGELQRVPPQRLHDCHRGIIDSALASPQPSFEGVSPYPDLPSKAAVLTYSLAKSQACPDGNKRLTAILVFEFMAMNQADFRPEQGEFADVILRVAASDAAQRDDRLEELDRWFRDVLSRTV
jgi:prophage maintenance system killer protein